MMSFKKTSLMMLQVFVVYFFVLTVGAGSAMAASKILYVPEVGTGGQIYVMNADGSNPTNISNNSFSDLYASWSPDGSQIVFRSNRGGVEGLYVMDADGSNVTTLSTDPIMAFTGDVVWSPELPANVASISPFGQFVIVFMLGGASALWMTKRRQAASPLAT